MFEVNVSEIPNILQPSRFPRFSDKLINIVIVTAAISIAPFRSLVGGTAVGSEFRRLYRNLMPREMLVQYRDCLFSARRGCRDIYLLRSASEPWAKTYFDPEPGDNVVDIGAHVGKYALPSAKRVGEEGQVVALEPLPDNVVALKHNAELNELDNVTAVQAAAYDENKEMVIDGWELRDTDAVTDGDRDAADGLSVDARTVDSLLNEQGINEVEYVKIDIEGDELNALRGMETTLRASPNLTMLVEIERQNVEAVDALLTDLGYKGTPIEASDTGERQDYLYVKPDAYDK